MIHYSDPLVRFTNPMQYSDPRYDPLLRSTTPIRDMIHYSDPRYDPLLRSTTPIRDMIHYSDPLLRSET
ncbi:hypothetical protein VZT92_021304 [Zoarces viviparus]|uniref:Uncharacterized protein n=1 Tax=Zoarces viviparus TaxID=48416 RepID=A0AAW1EGT6_ZOAVI